MACRPQLPGKCFTRDEVAARLQKMLKDQRIKDAQRYKLPLLEERLSTMPAAVAEEVRDMPRVPSACTLLTAR